LYRFWVWCASRAIREYQCKCCSEFLALSLSLCISLVTYQEVFITPRRYDGEIDNIVGIVLAKSVLDFFVNGVLVDEDLSKKISKSIDDVVIKEVVIEEEEDHPREKPANGSAAEKHSSEASHLYSADRIAIRTKSGDAEGYVRTLTASELASRMEKSIEDAGLIESCYFVPDTANGWSVLQEMRKRRVHLAIVVDEYGGTEGKWRKRRMAVTQSFFKPKLKFLLLVFRIGFVGRYCRGSCGRNL